LKAPSPATRICRREILYFAPAVGLDPLFCPAVGIRIRIFVVLISPGKTSRAGAERELQQCAIVLQAAPDLQSSWSRLTIP